MFVVVMRFQKIIGYAIPPLFILPFILNSVWYSWGGDWLYWVSRSLWSLGVIVFGLIVIVVIIKLKNNKKLQDQSLFMKIVLFVYGIILVAIGIFLLSTVIGRLFQGCQPLNCA